MEKLLSELCKFGNSIQRNCKCWVDRVIQTLFSGKFDKQFSIILLIAFLIVIYLFNKHTTLIVDDYDYSFIYHSSKRVSNIMDVVESQYTHYFKWGGRAIVHFLAQTFLMFDKSIFDVLNSLAYIALVVVINFHATGSYKISPAILVIINWVFFICMPAFGQVFLWVTGSCNYLWGTLIVMTYLLPYRFQMLSGSSVVGSKLFYIPIFLCGIIAGWTNENMGVTLIVMISTAVLFEWYKNRRIYTWMYLGLLGALFGTIAMIVAPGNFERLAVIAANNGGSAVNVVKNFFKITSFFFKPDFLLFPVGIIMILLVLKKQCETLFVSYWYLLGVFISMYSMVASPQFPNRAKLGTLVLATVVICYLYKEIDFSNIKLKKITAVVLILFFGATVDCISKGFKDIKAYEKNNKAKIEYVIEEKKNGVTDIVVPKIYPNTKFCAAYGLSDISTNPKKWPNTSFARYFGLNSVRTE